MKAGQPNSAARRALDAEHGHGAAARRSPAISSAPDKPTERDEQLEMQELFARAEAEDFYLTL
ncbi:UNVERIFIED_CONTAM: hypothetical protein IGO34_27085, partial [Salmonella enterica subsp. enterica serovar Weltevreden]